MSVFVNKQPMSFESCFGILQVGLGKGQSTLRCWQKICSRAKAVADVSCFLLVRP
jgi:hypothetical protein